MTYADFQSLVQAYLHQEGNPKISAQVDNFISLGEMAINRRVRTQRMLQTVLVSDLATGNPAVYPVPADFLEVFGLWQDGAPIEYLSVDELRKVGYGQGTGCSNSRLYYSLLGGYFLFTAAPADSMTLTYYAQPPVLSSIEGEIATSLFPRHQDLYLYSTLVEASPLLRDEPRAQYWLQQRERIMAEITAEDWNSSIPKGQLLKRNL